jgi:hypothetical protein
MCELPASAAILRLLTGNLCRQRTFLDLKVVGHRGQQTEHILGLSLDSRTDDYTITRHFRCRGPAGGFRKGVGA